MYNQDEVKIVNVNHNIEIGEAFKAGFGFALGVFVLSMIVSAVVGIITLVYLMSIGGGI